jgi:hypothetical protein
MYSTLKAAGFAAGSSARAAGGLMRASGMLKNAAVGGLRKLNHICVWAAGKVSLITDPYERM